MYESQKQAWVRNGSSSEVKFQGPVPTGRWFTSPCHAHLLAACSCTARKAPFFRRFHWGGSNLEALVQWILKTALKQCHVYDGLPLCWLVICLEYGTDASWAKNSSHPTCFPFHLRLFSISRIRLWHISLKAVAFASDVTQTRLANSNKNEEN